MMVYVILGETASGKSKAAIKACRKNGLPLLSSDAFSVYEGFDIGSAKSTKEELEGVEHHFISNVPWGEEMNVFSFQKEGRALLEGWKREKRDCLVVGGTFLYVKALLFPYEFPREEKPSSPRIPAPPLKEMVEELKRLDPASLQLIDTDNPRRVLRALDLARSGRKRASIIDNYSNTPLYPCVFLRIKTKREDLKERIAQRVLDQVQEGLFGEEERLEKLDPVFSSSFKGIGFKEIYQGKKTGLTRQQIIDQVIRDTIQYAKRQTTFLRHQFPYMVEVDGKDIPGLIEEDIRRRAGKESLEIPCVYKDGNTDAFLASCYRKGIRQVGIYGSVNMEEIRKKYPLLQVVLVDEKNKNDVHHPRFTNFVDFPKDTLF